MKLFHIAALALTCVSMSHPMQQAGTKTLPQQVRILKPFFSQAKSIKAIRTIMDKIEAQNLAYPDYARRKGIIWSDVLVKTENPSEILKEFNTTKVTQVNVKLEAQKPQSLLMYPLLQSIFSSQILPTMFETVKKYTNLPKQAYVSFFLQRCNESEQMDWHQDPGEDYEPQADYTMVLMLSDQNDPKYGWDGGEFKIRQGLPENTFDEKNVQTIIHRYNQAIIFNNKINSHLATMVKPKTSFSQRDIIVVLLALQKLPQKKS